jgi:hypothetical protein
VRNNLAFSILLLISLGLGIAFLALDEARLLILYLVVIQGVVLALRSEKYTRVILILSFAGLVVGWRGVPLWTELRFYAAEVFIWSGFAASVVIPTRRTPGPSREQGSALPLLLVVASIVGIAVGFSNGNDPEMILGQAKSMLVFVPALFLFRRWLNSERDILACATTVVIAATVISSLGLFEFFFPELSQRMTWLFPNPVYIRANFGGSGEIALSGFSSWGTPVVGVMLVPAFGFWIAMRHLVPVKFRAVSYAAASIIVVGILLSGYRSAWGGLIGIVALLVFFDRKLVAAALLGGVLLFTVLPQGFVDRLTTMWLLGESGDTSLLRREYILDVVATSVKENPVLGIGWGAFNTYNDYASLAVMLGIPALLIFSTWYTSVIRRTWIIARRFAAVARPRGSINPVGFLAALVGYLFCMMSGAMTFVQPLMLNFWLLFCLVLRYTEIVSGPGLSGVPDRSRRTGPVVPPILPTEGQGRQNTGQAEHPGPGNRPQ